MCNYWFSFWWVVEMISVGRMSTTRMPKAAFEQSCSCRSVSECGCWKHLWWRCTFCYSMAYFTSQYGENTACIVPPPGATWTAPFTPSSFCMYCGLTRCSLHLYFMSITKVVHLCMSTILFGIYICITNTKGQYLRCACFDDWGKLMSTYTFLLQCILMSFSVSRVEVIQMRRIISSL